MKVSCFLLVLLSVNAAEGTSYLSVQLNSLIIRDGSDFSKDPLFLTVCVTSVDSIYPCDVGRGWITGYRFSFPPLFVQLGHESQEKFMFNITVHTAEDLIAADIFQTSLSALSRNSRKKIDSHSAIESTLTYYTEIRCMERVQFFEQASIVQVFERHCDTHCQTTVFIALLLIVLLFLAILMTCCKIKRNQANPISKSNNTTGSGLWLFEEKQVSEIETVIVEPASDTSLTHSTLPRSETIV